MFEIIKPGTTFDIVGKRHVFVWGSIIAIAITFALFFTKGLNYGIDFTGGAEVQVKLPASWDTGKLRAELEAGGIKHAKIQEIALGGETGAVTERQYLVKAQGDENSLKAISQGVQDIIGKTLKAGEFEMMRVDVVGPAAGADLRKRGFLSMVYALICILLYVTLRFDARYSPGAVLALFHDTALTVGFFVITQKQFDLQILAAILALIGYSNNDTIIVFDRVRETLHLHPRLSIEQAVNKAVNETLGRTMLTSLSTFLSVFALWAFGGAVIRDFAVTLMFGIAVGTYSSVFIASSLVIFLTHYMEKKKTGAPGKPKKQYQVRPEPKFQ